MRLFVRGLAYIKLTRLAVMIGKAIGTDAAFRAVFVYCSATEAANRQFARRIFRQGIRLIRNTACGLRHLHVSIALMITKWTFGRVDWNLVEIGRAKARKLRIVI